MKRMLLLLAALALVPLAPADTVGVIRGGADVLNFDTDKGVPASGKYHALSCTNTSCNLIVVDVVTKAAPVWNYGDASQPHPGHVTELPSGRFMLAFFRGVPNLRLGRVSTWYARNQAEFSRFHIGAYVVKSTPELLSLNLSGEPMTVRIVDHGRQASESRKLECSAGAKSWRLEYDGLNQELASVCMEKLEDHNGGGPPSLGHFLKWVGDLDRDSRPDILVEPDACGASADLYLSSQRENGKPWPRAATFFHYDPLQEGC